MFLWSFVLQVCFCMSLIAATRAEGELVCFDYILIIFFAICCVLCFALCCVLCFALHCVLCFVLCCVYSLYCVFVFCYVLSFVMFCLLCFCFVFLFLLRFLFCCVCVFQWFCDKSHIIDKMPLKAKNEVNDIDASEQDIVKAFTTLSWEWSRKVIHWKRGFNTFELWEPQSEIKLDCMAPKMSPKRWQTK